MIGKRQHFKELSHQLSLALNRLIGIGIGADSYCFGGTSKNIP
jgi:hypothetical protein